MPELYRSTPLNSLVKTGPAQIKARDLSINEQPFIRKTLLIGQPLSVMSDNNHCLRLPPNQWLLLGEIQLDDLPDYAVDVTDKYQMFKITGSNATALLSTGCSLDLREKVFKGGHCAQCRIEQVPVILFRQDANYFVMAERSLTRHLWMWFEQATREFK